MAEDSGGRGVSSGKPEPRPLEGKAALVTGAGKGIGRAVADRLAADGAQVCRFDLQFDADGGGSAAAGLSFVGDVTESRSIDRCLAVMKQECGPPDIVVNSAGVTSHVSFVELTETEWSRVVTVNLTGTFLVCRAAIGEMLTRGGGRIINIASELGLVGAPRLAHYCASKGGVIAFSKALAREFAPQGISVNVVAPGAIETDMLMAYPEEYNSQTLATIPLGRWGRPEEVAATVAFVASSGASYYTGWIFSPNGGVVM
jgi:NAD(P)-dependent dehydrogenase (short-subunit alcohol dehydrogenase family)